VDDDEANGKLPTDLERLLAGTLALMTTWYQCPQPAICHKLLENLSMIGAHASVSDGLKRVCANAAARWAAYLEEVEIAIDSGDDDEDDEPVGVLGHPSPGPATLH
jgi:hypothetical protein